MLELNKVMLIGNLTRDPEYRNTSTGKAVAKLALAVNRRRTDRETGEMQEDTMFIDVDAWNRLADFAQNYLQKGRRIYVEGRLRQDKWQDRETGGNRYKIVVVAETIQFALPKSAEMGAGRDMDSGGGPDADDEPQAGASAGGGRTEDDLPF
jgi:single-strand DNA-binding protein